jgi:K(+)-stimulated pyrophosphate-energized sodium pump
MGALYKGVIVTGVLALIALFPLTAWLVGMDTAMKVGEVSFTGKDLFYCGAVGLIVTALIIVITEYYTGTNYRPVQSIAKASVTGHGTNVIQGLAVSLESPALPARDHTGIVIAYQSPACSASPSPSPPCSLAGMIVALDAFGSVTDNAAALPRWPACPRTSARRPTRSMPSATPPRR